MCLRKGGLSSNSHVFVAIARYLLRLFEFLLLDVNIQSKKQTKMSKNSAKKKGKSKPAAQRSKEESSRTPLAAAAAPAPPSVDIDRVAFEERIRAETEAIEAKMRKEWAEAQKLKDEEIARAQKKIEELQKQLDAKVPDSETEKRATESLNNVLQNSLFAPLIVKSENATYAEKV